MGLKQNDFRRGTAELLVLHLLSERDLYGYQFIETFSERSDGIYTMVEGSLYPILYRLAEGGYLSTYIKPAGVKRTRKYYHIEEKGKVYYQELLDDFVISMTGINNILYGKQGDEAND